MVWFDLIWLVVQEKYNFALVTNHFSSEAESLKFGDTLKRIRSIDDFQVRGHFQQIFRYLLVVSVCGTLGKNVCALQVFPFTSSTRVPVMNMIIFLKSKSLKISITKKNVSSSRAAFLFGSLPYENLPLPGLDSHSNCKGDEGGRRGGGDGWVMFDEEKKLYWKLKS